MNGTLLLIPSPSLIKTLRSRKNHRRNQTPLRVLARGAGACSSISYPSATLETIAPNRKTMSPAHYTMLRHPLRSHPRVLRFPQKTTISLIASQMIYPAVAKSRTVLRTRHLLIATFPSNSLSNGWNDHTTRPRTAGFSTQDSPCRLKCTCSQQGPSRSEPNLVRLSGPHSATASMRGERWPNGP